MPKKLTRSKLVKKLDTIFSIYIRRKNAVNSTRWDEVNFQVQCAGCNVFKYGEQYVFGNKLDIKYGSGTAERLYLKSKQIIKLSNPEIKDLILRYKNFVDLMD